MVEAVAAANPTIVDPDLILVGWKITLPELDVDEPVDDSPRTVDGEATWTVVTVREGDTLWDIVDEHYGDATAELVWATVEANPEIDDPAVILPGQLITLPPSGVAETDLSGGISTGVGRGRPATAHDRLRRRSSQRMVLRRPLPRSRPRQRSTSEPRPPVLNGSPTAPPSSALPSPTTVRDGVVADG